MISLSMDDGADVTARQEMNEEWRTELEQTILAVCSRKE